MALKASACKGPLADSVKVELADGREVEKHLLVTPRDWRIEHVNVARRPGGAVIDGRGVRDAAECVGRVADVHGAGSGGGEQRDAVVHGDGDGAFDERFDHELCVDESDGHG